MSSCERLRMREVSSIVSRTKYGELDYWPINLAGGAAARVDLVCCPGASLRDSGGAEVFGMSRAVSAAYLVPLTSDATAA
jgi:hypothetical protein